MGCEVDSGDSIPIPSLGNFELEVQLIARMNVT